MDCPDDKSMAIEFEKTDHQKGGNALDYILLIAVVTLWMVLPELKVKTTYNFRVG